MTTKRKAQRKALLKWEVGEDKGYAYHYTHVGPIDILIEEIAESSSGVRYRAPNGKNPKDKHVFKVSVCGSGTLFACDTAKEARRWGTDYLRRLAERIRL